MFEGKTNSHDGIKLSFKNLNILCMVFVYNMQKLQPSLRLYLKKMTKYSRKVIQHLENENLEYIIKYQDLYEITCCCAFAMDGAFSLS